MSLSSESSSLVRFLLLAPSLLLPSLNKRIPKWPEIVALREITPLHFFTQRHIQGGPPWPSDAISIESNGISNRSNRNSQKFSNGRKIARMTRIFTIFGWNQSSRRNLSFRKFSNERKIIESIESIDWIGQSIDRIDRWPPRIS